MASITLISASTTTVVLQKVRPIEMLPMVGQYAPEIEFTVGALGVFTPLLPKGNEIVLGAYGGMLASGAIKLLDKYVPMKA